MIFRPKKTEVPAQQAVNDLWAANCALEWARAVAKQAGDHAAMRCFIRLESGIMAVAVTTSIPIAVAWPPRTELHCKFKIRMTKCRNSFAYFF